MTLTFNTNISSLNQLFSGHRLQKFLKIPLFSLSPIEKPKLQNLTCHKISQGQPRVINCTYYDGQESPMLHTKFRRNRVIGTREEDF